MGLKCGGIVLVAVVAMSSMFGIAMGNRNWSNPAGNWSNTAGKWNNTAGGTWNNTAGGTWNNTAGGTWNNTAAGNWNHTEGYWGQNWHKSSTQTSKRIVVGGSENWHFGYNYTEWAIKNGPFYLNDTLVFKYDPPNDTTFPHSVYLLRDFRSFKNCDLRRAKKIAEVTQGGGNGFEFVLKRWQPYYFACGERNGLHCNVGMMKFAAWPLIPAWYHY